MLGVVLAVAAGVALGVGLARVHNTAGGGKVLEVSEVEDEVARILADPIDGYGVAGATDIVCNGGVNPEVIAGAEFTCRVVVNGERKSVLVVFQDGTGTYAVDRPR